MSVEQLWDGVEKKRRDEITSWSMSTLSARRQNHSTKQHRLLLRQGRFSHNGESPNLTASLVWTCTQNPVLVERSRHVRSLAFYVWKMARTTSKLFLSIILAEPVFLLRHQQAKQNAKTSTVSVLNVLCRGFKQKLKHPYFLKRWILYIWISMLKFLKAAAIFMLFSV